MIVLHIGLRKAGSTSIQAFLAENELTLRAHGVEYPRQGRRNRIGHRMVADGILGGTRYPAHRGDPAALADFWRKSEGDVMIVSSEAFQASTTEQALRLGKLRRAPNEPIRVIMVVRDLLEVVPSSYAQMVKIGRRTHSFDEFFGKKTRGVTIQSFQIAQIWADAFGWENLYVRVLDRDFLTNGDLIDDFMSQAGLDVAADWVVSLVRPGAANVTPGWRVVEAVRALYTGRAGLDESHPLANAGIYSKEQRARIGRLALEVGDHVGWNTDRGRYLTREQAQKCLEIYAASVHELNFRLPYGLPEPLDLEARAFLPRVAQPDAGLISPSDLREFYDALAIAFGDVDGAKRVALTAANGPATPCAAAFPWRPATSPRMRKTAGTS